MTTVKHQSAYCGCVWETVSFPSGKTISEIAVVCDLHSHWHCPNGCDKPQPFERDGAMICGKCFHDSGAIVPAILCSPEICD